ncbi:MAG: hypothetical protein EOM70_05240 [Clostridia bacterium]|nr:hypothetical protein [Clostridia bacterium]
MRSLLIIQDMRGWFWKTYPTPNQTKSLDTRIIVTELAKCDFEVQLTRYDRFDFSKNYTGHYVLYGSSEDYLGGSKSYMDDILLWLELHGAILIPNYKYFRAHHNKVMMELLRQDFSGAEFKTIQSTVLPSASSGQAIQARLPLPAVIKSASGAGSTGVYLARTARDMQIAIRKASCQVSGFPYTWIQLHNLLQFLKRKAPLYVNNSKYVVQNLIPGLAGDYKVLIFGQRYFALYRLNRTNDFRASGSGRFVDREDPELFQVLDFARRCHQEIDSPFVSLDIAHDGQQAHLIEFQCVSFGFKAMSLSDHHYVSTTGHWQRLDGPVVPELIFSQAIMDYVAARDASRIC